MRRAGIQDLCGTGRERGRGRGVRGNDQVNNNRAGSGEEWMEI